MLKWKYNKRLKNRVDCSLYERQALTHKYVLKKMTRKAILNFEGNEHKRINANLFKEYSKNNFLNHLIL